MAYREFNCAVCGAKAIDRGQRQHKIYCSESCCTKAYLRRNGQQQKIVISCRYNEGVCCDSMNCDNCGWNPVVEERRKESLYERQTENQQCDP